MAEPLAMIDERAAAPASTSIAAETLPV